jgi:hypothetical protein
VWIIGRCGVDASGEAVSIFLLPSREKVARAEESEREPDEG